jgi:tetratricopeptide (TPR) repeat protein
MSLQRLLKVSSSIFTICIVLMVFLNSCSTKKNMLTSRVYHNLTARYNVYFNAKEALKAGEKSIEMSHKDNYITVLPMFLYSDKAACSSASGSMQRAIDKSNKLIKEHSITAKPKFKNMELSVEQKQFYSKRNFCNWVDDAYFVMGKAYLMKHDYFAANKSFETVANEYKNEDLKIPARLWQARSKTEEGQTEDAIEILDKLAEDPKFPSEYRLEMAAVYANAYIKAENYREAILRLEEAISLTKKKSTKNRYTYILAQLYQLTKDNSKAQELFTNLLKRPLPYEMAFNAKINLATSFQSGSSDDIKRMLNKLLRDSKNKEFRDQIYFALANIYFREPNIDKALETYKLSLSSTVSNKYQKSMSFLAIGDIYYDRKQYINAQPYYDSCVTLIDETVRGYQALVTKSKNLNELAKNYVIVVTQDSLQRMAKMSPNERNVIIDKAIKAVNDKELEAQRMELEASKFASLSQPMGTADDQNASKWYFYNTSMVSLGKIEFIKQWGSRKLEDDWRRKNKAAVVNNPDEDENASATDSTGAVKRPKLSNKTREYYMQDVPMTDSAFKISEAKVDVAMFNVGSVFMNKIEDFNQGVETFEKYVKRFPESEMLVTAYYNLYTMYRELANQPQAEYYKDLITSKFPNSKYAQAITNPNFFRDIKARDSKIETIFKKAYKAYFQENFPDVITAVAEAEKDFPDCATMPKFQFLKAMSNGRMSTANEMQKQLTDFIAKYPKNESVELAKRIIDFINEQKQNGVDANAPLSTLMKDTTSVTASQANIEQKKKEEKPIYTFQENVQHYFVIAADAEGVKSSRIKFNAINYNLEYFSNFPFDITEKTLGKKYNVVVIKPFSDSHQALSYYDLTTISDELFEGIDKTKTEQFIISESNFEILQKEYQLDKYLEFFYQNYIK